MRRVSVFAVLLLLSAISLWATEAQVNTTAHLRIAHFSPDAPDVDVYLNGTLSETQGLRFPNVTDWLELEAETIEVVVVPAGRPIDDVAVAPVSVTLAADGWYTIAVIGLLTRGTLDIAALEEDFSAPTDGNIRISMFHAISDIPPINVIANDITLVQTLGYPGFFGDNDGFTTADIPAGTYEIVITPFDAPASPLVEVGTYTLGAGSNYFVAAVGTSTNPLFVLISSDMAALREGGASTSPEEASQDLGAGNATIRLAHLSSGTPAVDVYLNGELSDVQALAFGAFTTWVEVPAGVYSVAVAPTGTSLADAILGPADISLATDQVYTLAVIGILDNDSLSIEVLVEDFAPLDAGQARLSIFHAAASTGAISLTANADELLFGLPFAGTTAESGDGFATRDILAGDYDLQITLTDDADTVLVDLPETRLESASNTLIAVIDADPSYIITTTQLSQINGE